jgi:hypothetical protein
MARDAPVGIAGGAQRLLIDRHPTVGNHTSGSLPAGPGQGERGEAYCSPPPKVCVEIAGSSYGVEPETWQHIQYRYRRETNRIEEEVVGTFTQYPLRLAWAITIHKSQGQTFERVLIDLGRGAFAPGQTYVALSRCTPLEGVVLSRPVTPRDMLFDERVYGYTRVFPPAPSRHITC